MGFAAPWLLTALALLPVLWWLLRAIPPAPRRLTFPAIRLLLPLANGKQTPAVRTRWQSSATCAASAATSGIRRGRSPRDSFTLQGTE